MSLLAWHLPAAISMARPNHSQNHHSQETSLTSTLPSVVIAARAVAVTGRRPVARSALVVGPLTVLLASVRYGPGATVTILDAVARLIGSRVRPASSLRKRASRQ